MIINPAADRLVELGATRLEDLAEGDSSGVWTVMQDPEGNEFCVQWGWLLTAWSERQNLSGQFPSDLQLSVVGEVTEEAPGHPFDRDVSSPADGTKCVDDLATRSADDPFCDDVVRRGVEYRRIGQAGT